MTGVCLVFDCMETLVDMIDLPEPKDYAAWAYLGSGVEGLWENFDEFWTCYAANKVNHHEQHGALIEQDLIIRLTTLVEQATQSKRQRPNELRGMTVDEAVARLFENFWSNYLKRCYVRDEVSEALQLFQQKNYAMGVVSNFTVRGGVEEILEKCGIHHYFQFIHTSIDNTYRKPHPNLFYDVLRSCGCEAENVYYLGDDYECDYVGATGFGFNTYLLDRENRYSEVECRVSSFKEFADLVIKSRL